MNGIKIEPDVSNTDPKYWEKVLEKERLGIRQLGLSDSEESEFSPASPLSEADTEILQSVASIRKSTNNKDIEQITRYIDKDDPFLKRGFGIKKPYQYFQRLAPTWALSDNGVRGLIQKAFPKWRTDAKQHRRAARWVRVIYLCYRVGMTRPQAAKEMGLTPGAVKNCLNYMRRVASGKTSIGLPRRR